MLYPRNFILFLFVCLLCLACTDVADAKCGGGSGRAGVFRQSRHAFHATRHQALADHHAVRHNRLQGKRTMRMGGGGCN